MNSHMFDALIGQCANKGNMQFLFIAQKIFGNIFFGIWRAATITNIKYIYSVYTICFFL